MKKTFKRFLSAFMSVLMIIQIMPMSVLAKNTVQKQAIESTEAQIKSDSSDVVIKTEIESMRTENSKTFLTDDNGYYQVTSALPLHNNINGEWIDKSETNNSEISTVSDIETYVNEQIEESLSAQSDEDESTRTITSTGDTYVDNCQTQISTYSSTGSTDLSVKYVRVGKATQRAEIYIKPFFPTDHAIFVTSATIKANVSNEYILGDYNLVAENTISQDWTGTVQYTRLNFDDSTNYDLIEMYADEDDSGAKTYNVDMTNYCNYTRIGLIPNYGVALIAEESGTNVTFDNLTVEMYYHEIEDIDDNFEYEQVDLGRAGKVYINDYTCSPVIVRDEMGLNGEIAPVAIQTIINPMDNLNDIGFGKHTRINYYSTLVYDENSHIYLWKNCEGENLYLNYTTSNHSDYKFSGTLGTDDSGNYTYDNITITDNSNQKKYKFTTYNGTGYLTEITDGSENNNSIYIEYSNIGNLHAITKITDGYGRQYILTYLNNHLYKISAKNSNDEPIYMNSEDAEHPLEITYSYVNNLLNTVTYADNEVISYTYNNEKFTEIQNIDGSKITFEYESKFDGESYKLSTYEMLSSIGNLISKVDIEAMDEKIYYRKFTNSNNSTKELTFDRSFNMIRLKNYNNIEYFLNYSNNELQYILTSDTVAENLVKNGTFHEVANGQPTQWTYESTDNSTIGQNIQALNGDNNNRTLHMDNYMDICRAYQIVEKTGYTFNANKSYILSGFVYRNSDPIAISDTRDLCIYVYDTKVENGITVPDNCLTKMDFDDTLGEEWQQRKTIFTTQKDTSSLIIYLSYNNMIYTCDFDNIEIYEATVKNAIDAQDIIPSSEVEYDYSENNSILEEIKTDVDGDEIGAFYNYTDDENYISKITNNGVPTYYSYDNDNGLLLSKGSNSDSSKNAQYNYTAVGLLESVKQAISLIDTNSTVDIRTDYTYENDRIKTIEHNNCIYEYEYDVNGRVTGINQYSTNTSSNENETEDDSDGINNTAINKNNIISYQYSNDEISTISYGNGATILYEYNQLGYITRITYVPASIGSSESDEERTNENSEQTVIPIVYEYIYDDYGNVTSYMDHSNNTVLTIENGIYTIREAGENGEILYQRDGNNRNVFSNKIKTTNSQQTSSSGKTTDSKIFNLYTPGRVLPTNIVSASTVYDSVGRTFETIATDSSATVTNESTYVTNGITTSNLVNTYISSLTRLSDASAPRIYRRLTYSYNDRGQITDVYRAAVNMIPENTENTSTSINRLKNEILKHYEYDEAGQIILDVNMDSFKAIKYRYNEGGNLISKTTYQNEDSDDRSAFYYRKSTGKYIFNDDNAITKSYEYSSEWSDILTKYNNHSIEYDEIGNPVDYYGEDIVGNEVSGTMTWDGNRLTSFDDGNHKYIYKYSADGFRTQKIMYNSNSDTVVTQMDYVYENDNLVGIRTRVYDPKGPDDEEQPLTHEVVTNIISNSTNETVGLDIQITAFDQEVEKNGVISFEDVTNKVYFYILRDGQGNITDMYNSTEDIVLHFSYDAYGNCDLTFSGNLLHDILNQLQGSSGWRKVLQIFVYALVLNLVVGGTMGTTQQTYKGYVCDYETGLYYSQNRFYSPSWGRFLNMDDPNMLAKTQGEVFGANLFNYCNNDPVNNVDLSGYAPTSYDTSVNILSVLDIDQLNTIQVGVVPSKLHGKVKNEMTIFGLSLATVKDEDDKKYWNRVFGTTENIVQKTNGNNYMDTVISKQSGVATIYNLKPSTSPYKIGE